MLAGPHGLPGACACNARANGTTNGGGGAYVHRRAAFLSCARMRDTVWLLCTTHTQTRAFLRACFMANDSGGGGSGSNATAVAASWHAVLYCFRCAVANAAAEEAIEAHNVFVYYV